MSTNIIIDRLFFSPKVFPGVGLDVKPKYIRWGIAFPVVVTLLILRSLNQSSLVILIGGVLVYFYFFSRYQNELNAKIDFLNSIIYNGNEQPFDMRSYLYLDEELVNFYYNIKYYIEDNLTAYRKSLVNVNNLLKLEFDISKNYMREPEQFYKLALMECKSALNNLHSLIYKLVSHQVNNDLFNDNLATLEKLLKKHLDKLKGVIKCDYNLYDLNIWSLPYPSNLDLENDLKDKYYSPHYSFY